MDALIGYTGFVGSNLALQRKFDAYYNSANIEKIAGLKFDTIFCAGIPGTKWLANKNPREDLTRINRLLDNLNRVQCRKFILISTVDVYKDPVEVDENTPIVGEGLQAYGRHRAAVEQFVREKFKDAHIIRLPAIYGSGLKKNFVYDLLHNHCLDWTHRDSIFQFYCLNNLNKDINTVLAAGIRLINFNAQPISARELARTCFHRNFVNIPSSPPLHYDVRTVWASLFSGDSRYMYTREQVLEDMTRFVAQWQSSGGCTTE